MAQGVVMHQKRLAWPDFPNGIQGKIFPVDDAPLHHLGHEPCARVSIYHP
jgi:hypothetical protein